MEPFDTNAELLRAVKNGGHECQVLGYAPGGEPLVAIRTGGDKEPGIVLSAGSHAEEHAGVRAAVALLDRIETNHRVHVLPTRDPVGLNGYGSAFGVALDEPPDVNSFRDAEEIIQTNGDVISRQNGFTIGLIGDYGFLTRASPELPADGHALGEEHVEDLGIQESDVLTPLKGRRIYLPPGLPDVEGTGNFDRAHTIIVSPEGAVKHLNRFHDTPWAPTEPRCLRRLLGETSPGLFIDMHEFASNGERFHFSLRRTGDEEEEQLAERIGRSAARTVDDTGGKLASWEDKFGDTPVEEHHYTPVEDGVFWLEHTVRNRQSGERQRPFYETPGLNSSDFVAEEYGLGFGMDTGMYASFEERVEQAVVAVQAAVSEFENRGQSERQRKEYSE